MTKEEKKKVVELRALGMSYQEIARCFSLPLSTVKSWLIRHSQKEEKGRCRFCGAPIQQTPHKRERKYCSDECRYRWWSKHPEVRTINKKRKEESACSRGEESAL